MLTIDQKFMLLRLDPVFLNHAEPFHVSSPALCGRFRPIQRILPELRSGPGLPGRGAAAAKPAAQPQGAAEKPTSVKGRVFEILYPAKLMDRPISARVYVMLGPQGVATSSRGSARTGSTLSRSSRST